MKPCPWLPGFLVPSCTPFRLKLLGDMVPFGPVAKHIGKEDMGGFLYDIFGIRIQKSLGLHKHKYSGWLPFRCPLALPWHPLTPFSDLKTWRPPAKKRRRLPFRSPFLGSPETWRSLFTPPPPQKKKKNAAGFRRACAQWRPWRWGRRAPRGRAPPTEEFVSGAGCMLSG